MKPIQKPKIHTMKMVYADYALSLLMQNPEWWGVYDVSSRMQNGIIYCKEKGKVVEKMSWKLWKEITESYFHKAKESIIQGKELRFGAGVGKLRACRIERNMSRPVINWSATFKLNEYHEDGKRKKVFYTTDDYCRIEWVKTRTLTNEKCYNFTVAEKNTRTGKGFKIEFSKALQKDPLLKFRYVYYPLHNKHSARCNTNTPL